MLRRCWSTLTRTGFAAVIATAAAGAETSPNDAAERARAASVVVVGEIHDNSRHHEVQAEFAEVIAPTAIVFEMFSAADAGRLRELMAEHPDIDALADALDWQNSGWPDLEYYTSIAQAAPAADIYGALVGRERAREAFSDGAAGVFGDGAARFGLDRSLSDTEQALREELQDDAHCNAMPAEMLGGMVEAQRLRDAALAQATLDALAATGGPVLVITGNGHARTDWGMPALLALAAPGIEVYSFAQFEADPGAEAPFDAWHVTAAVEREDPCAAFR